MAKSFLGVNQLIKKHEKKDLKIKLKEVGFRTVVLFDGEWYAEFTEFEDAELFVVYWKDYKGVKYNITVEHEKH